jgi:hypothetical protein
MMTDRSAYRSGIRGLGMLAFALLLAAPAAALEFHIGGNDRISQYYGFDGSQPWPGLLTFQEPSNGSNPTPDLGSVTSEDLAGGGANCSLGANVLCNAKVEFDAILGPISQQGVNFVPSTSNIKQAIFLGANVGADMVFIDPNDNVTVLLAFELNFIEVTQASKELLPQNPDGTILLGNPTGTADSSKLVLIGGTLNQLVGGVGSEARLQLLMDSLTPSILAKGDFAGFLNGNFLSGAGGTPVLPTVFDMTIIAIPEPSTAALLGFSLLSLLALARRSSRRR